LRQRSPESIKNTKTDGVFGVSRMKDQVSTINKILPKVETMPYGIYMKWSYQKVPI
jgi:hypothetical protein